MPACTEFGNGKKSYLWLCLTAGYSYAVGLFQSESGLQHGREEAVLNISIVIRSTTLVSSKPSNFLCVCNLKPCARL